MRPQAFIATATVIVVAIITLLTSIVVSHARGMNWTNNPL